LSGSRRSPSSNSNCFICMEKGHTIFTQQDSPTAVKFPNGKQTWAKSNNRSLVTADNCPLSINWNVQGDQAPQHFTCTHSKDKCAHLCLFCSSKSLHTLSLLWPGYFTGVQNE
jgi:hypothetical protein